jgi:hypothetical protein
MSNGYLNRKNAERNALIFAAQDAMMQYDVDILTILLHSRGYGKTRMMTLIDEFIKLHDKYMIAFDPSEPEADYYRELLDREMRAVFGEDADPFEVRFPAAKQIFYDKPMKHKKRK